MPLWVLDHQHANWANVVVVSKNLVAFVVDVNTVCFGRLYIVLLQCPVSGETANLCKESVSSLAEARLLDQVFEGST